MWNDRKYIYQNPEMFYAFFTVYFNDQKTELIADFTTIKNPQNLYVHC